MKKRFLQTFSALTPYGFCMIMLSMVLASCKTDDAGIVGENYTITLDRADERLAERQTLTVTTSFNNPEAAKLKYKWLSMNLTAATVVGDANGATVTGVKEGAAEIKIVSVDNPKLWAIFTVDVFERNIGLDKGLDGTESIFKGGTLTVTPTFGGEGAADLAYTWSSSDDGIATVGKGAGNVATVTGMSPGVATITITCDTDPELKASFDVNVVPYTITLNPNGGAVRRNGGTLLITPSYNDPGAEEFAYTWTSDNTDIATVVKNGNGTATVTGVAGGTAKITVTCDTDPTLTASCDVTVETWSVSLDKTDENLEELSDLLLTPGFTPAAASLLNYTWTSSDTGVATVTKNANGTATVRGVVAGTATITIKADVDESITASCIVNVTPLTGLPFNFDKVFIDGTAIGTKTEVAVTLENPDLFAWYGDLVAGTLTIPTELSGSDFYYVAPEDGVAEFASSTEEAVEAATMSLGASTWTIPSTGKYRIVINKETKTLAVYSPEIDLQPLYVEWLDGTNTLGTYVEDFFIVGNDRWGMDPSKDKAGFIPSAADPQVLVLYDNVKPFGNSQWDNQDFKFVVYHTVTPRYTFTCGTTSGNASQRIRYTMETNQKLVGGYSTEHRECYYRVMKNEFLRFIVIDLRNLTFYCDSRN